MSIKPFAGVARLLPRLLHESEGGQHAQQLPERSGREAGRAPPPSSGEPAQSSCCCWKLHSLFSTVVCSAAGLIQATK
jgi:hypothetical protein